MTKQAKALELARWNLVPKDEQTALIKELKAQPEGHAAIELGMPEPVIAPGHGFIVHGEVVPEDEQLGGRYYLFLSDLPKSERT